MISTDANKHSQDELEILRLLARGEKEIEAGKGYELAAIFADVDSMLKKSTSGRTGR